MKMTFTQKLSMIIAVLVIVSGAIAWFGINGAGKINDSLNDLVDNEAKKVALSARIQQNVLEMQRAEKNLILATTLEDMDAFTKAFEAAQDEADKKREELRNLVSDEMKSVLDDFRAKYTSYVDTFKQVSALTRENSNVKAKVLLNGDAKVSIDKVDKLTDELRKTISQNLNKKLDEKSRTQIKSLAYISSIESNILKSIRDAGRAIIAVDEEEIASYVKSSNNFLTLAYTQTGTLKRSVDKADRDLVEKTIIAMAEYDKIQSAILELTSKNSNQRAMALSQTKAREYVSQARELITKVAQENEVAMNQAKAKSDVDYSDIKNLNIGVAIGGILIALIIAYFMVRQMMNLINNSVNSVSEGAEQVASASNQISSSSQQLAEGAQEQAASVEEITSSLTELKATIEQNSENAREADILGKDANESAKMGYDHIQNLSKSMTEINDSSRRIANIIKTIDEIAFQTNLLALNAAVEAARAGEHGLGFAVVAEEVRNLARRSAEAAKDTANIIEQSIADVQKGNQITEQTNSAFVDILDKVKKSGDIVGEIAIASKEQATGINQLSEAMSQVDSVTQVIASNSEESAAASEEMSAQAITMKGTIAELASIFGILTEESNKLAISNAHTTKQSTPTSHFNGAKKATLSVPTSKKPSDIMPLDDDDLREF
nr:methyl-accepting chemotaxis protein [uncultured Sulfurimonas sp.]